MSVFADKRAVKAHGFETLTAGGSPRAREKATFTQEELSAAVIALKRMLILGLESRPALASPDFSIVGHIAVDGHLKLFNVETCEEISLFEADGTPLARLTGSVQLNINPSHRAVFSPDKRFVVVWESQRSAVLINLETGKRVEWNNKEGGTVPMPSRVIDVKFTPDSSEVLLFNQYIGVLKFGAENGRGIAFDNSIHTPAAFAERFRDLETGCQNTGLSPEEHVQCPGEGEIVHMCEAGIVTYDKTAQLCHVYKPGDAGSAPLLTMKIPNLKIPRQPATGDRVILESKARYTFLLDLPNLTCSRLLHELCRSDDNERLESVALLLRETCNPEEHLADLLDYVHSPDRLFPAFMEDYTRIRSLEFDDTGRLDSGVAPLCYIMASSSTPEELPLLELPVALPPEIGDECDCTATPWEIPSDLAIDRNEIFGRSCVIPGPDGFTTVKARGFMESRVRVQREAEVLAWLHALRRAGVDLRCEYPEPVVGSLAVIDTKGLPEEMRKSFRVRAEVSKDGFIEGIVYRTQNHGYWEYYHDIADREAARHSALCGIHDLCTLARYGVVHPDIIELFHGRRDQSRPDRGKYIISPDIVRPSRNQAGPGVVLAWLQALQFPNWGRNGLRDFSDLTTVQALASLDHPHSRHMHNNLERFPLHLRQKLILALCLSTYTFSWELLEGYRMLKHGEMHPGAAEDLAQFASEVFSTGWKAFSRSRHDPVQEHIDWIQKAARNIFFMSKAYHRYGESGEELPAKLFRSDRAVTISAGDGWGFISSGVIKRELGLSPGDDLKYGGFRFDDLFERPRADPRFNHPIASHLYRFRADVKELIAEIPPEDSLARFYSEYRSGWRWDGEHDDLGPINAPCAIDMTPALLYSFAMLRTRPG